MGNRRIIFLLLAAIAACAALLWCVQRKARFFPSDGKARATLLTQSLESLDCLVVERGDARLEVRRSGGMWSLYAPFAARADQGAVARLVDALEGARVSDAVRFQELRKRALSLKELGLAPPVATVRLSGPQWRSVVRLGSPTPLGGELYARVDELDQVLVIPAACAAALPSGPDDLRSRKLAHGDGSRVRGLEIRAPGKPFIKLAKEGGTWRLVQPTSGPASDALVNRLIETVYAARVATFVWPVASNTLDPYDADPAMKARIELYGLGSDVALQITLQEGASGPPTQFVVGRPVEDSAGLRYVLLHGGETIGAVSNDVAAAFSLRPSDLRDTRLFYLRPGEVSRVEVRLEDTLYAFAQTNAVWRLQAPAEGRVDQSAVKGMVEQLLQLSAERVTDEGDGALSSGGEGGAPCSYVELVGAQSPCRFVIAGESDALCRITFTNAPVAYHVARTNLPAALVSSAGVLSLCDKAIVRLPPDAIRRISVRREGASAAETLRRDSGAAVWRLGEGVAGQIAEEAVAAWTARLAQLQAARVERIGVSADEAGAYGLSAAWMEISVDVDAADALRKTLVVGSQAGPGERYAMLRGLDVVFVLDADTLRVLSTRLIQAL